VFWQGHNLVQLAEGFCIKRGIDAEVRGRLSTFVRFGGADACAHILVARRYEPSNYGVGWFAMSHIRLGRWRAVAAVSDAEAGGSRQIRILAVPA